MGYAAFYAAGVCTYALMATHLGWPFWVCLPLAAYCGARHAAHAIISTMERMMTTAIAKEDLARGLRERHIQLIALGGAIGVGLFYGSASAIKLAGPLLLISYIAGGIIMFLMMRALGEVAVAHRVSGSFSAYANHFISPLFGYLTGWTYWFAWVVTCMAEITQSASTCISGPDLPEWIPALAAALLHVGIGLFRLGRRLWRNRFWFAAIKIVTISVCCCWAAP